MAFPMPGIITDKGMIKILLGKCFLMNQQIKDLFKKSKIITSFDNGFVVLFKSAGISDLKHLNPQISQ